MAIIENIVDLLTHKDSIPSASQIDALKETILLMPLFIRTGYKGSTKEQIFDRLTSLWQTPVEVLAEMQQDKILCYLQFHGMESPFFLAKYSKEGILLSELPPMLKDKDCNH